MPGAWVGVALLRSWAAGTRTLLPMIPKDAAPPYVRKRRRPLLPLRPALQHALHSKSPAYETHHALTDIRGISQVILGRPGPLRRSEKTPPVFSGYFTFPGAEMRWLRAASAPGEYISTNPRKGVPAAATRSD